MEVKTYRASSMQEALMLVRSDLGPDAAVLHTREVQTGRFFGLMSGKRRIEVTASAGVNVPSRLPLRPKESNSQVAPPSSQADALTARSAELHPFDTQMPLHKNSSFRNVSANTGGTSHMFSFDPNHSTDMNGTYPNGHVQDQLSDLRQMVQDLCRQSHGTRQHDLPDSLFKIFTDLIEADIDEQLARNLVEQVKREIPEGELSDSMMVKARIARLVESYIKVSGPIEVTPGNQRLVALVGPTGVGKTTTIAKLAANYRLKKRQSVGLITVDTYRIAAVEQLRTYADIIDLPMQVVSTPREMREAVHRLAGLDLILMDTAGRSPRDEIKIQELKAFLTEAGADEVHLVLSSGAGSRALRQTAQQFAAVGTTSLILTKLDESTALGNLLPLFQSSNLPLSYLTNGQNVPDDIETAEAARLAQLILAGETAMLA
ncbi:MAG: flagellar biosynthesis protein FlhF [Pirellulales bacterium]|nr:flagellar biosynthesis protein FlhF [Pirellulales bacterium]